jgi:dTDP-glucose 4,6-dehydratase
MPRVLLTGSGGFIGAHVLEHFMVNTDWDMVLTDSFRHKGKTDRLASVLEPHPEWRHRISVVTHDLCAPFTPQTIKRLGHFDSIIAMASESHVDRSIDDPVPFVLNNVNVILNTLELARETKPERVIVISTDEVYGPLDAGIEWPEWSPIRPSNPYSASKAAQEAIASAYWRTYGVPVVIINCMNLIGERQDAEKYLPMVIKRIRDGEVVTIHGTPDNIGSRHYLHARNMGDAILFILRDLPEPAQYPAVDRPDRYNIVGPDRLDNLTLAQRVAKIMGEPLHYKLLDFHTARPGHDPHYGLDGKKLTDLGWIPPVPFDESLRKIIEWTLKHPEWIDE